MQPTPPRRWSVGTLALAVFFAVYFLVGLATGAFSSRDVWVILETLAAGVAAVALVVGY